MLKHALSLLLAMFFVAAFPAAGQQPPVCESVTFLDAQGQPATQYREGEPISFRVVAPAANVLSGQRDEVYMLLSARDSGDQETLSAMETGPDTGVFERSVRLGFGRTAHSDGKLVTARPPQPSGPVFDRISVQCGYEPPAAEADVLGPEVRFVDAGGHETSTVVAGFQLRLRVKDQAANFYPSVDTEQIRLVTAGGDEKIVTLRETGSETGVFEGSLPLTEGTAIPGDATLQATAGSAVEAQLLDAYGGTTAMAQADVAQRLLTFRDAAGAPLSVLVEGAAIRVELLDPLAIGFPNLTANATSAIAGDQESVALTPDPDQPGRFEGTLQLGIYSVYPFNGHLTTGRTYGSPPQFDTVTVSFCVNFPCATATAMTRNPEIHLLDAAGREPGVFAAGAPVQVRAFYPLLPAGYPESYARLESLVTGDLLDYLLLNATGGGFFEAPAATAAGPANPADAVVQVQPGEILKTTHIDYLNQPSAVATARIQAATLELVDAAGAPQGVFLIGRPVHLRAVYPAANANPAQAETVVARIDVELASGSYWRDMETLTLTETGPDTGVFAGSIPLAQLGGYPTANGVLEAGTDSSAVNRGDILRARVADASAMAETAYSTIRLTDAQGGDAESYPIGGTVHIEVTEPSSDQPGQQDSVFVWIQSIPTGDFEYLYLQETGTDTGVFAGSLATAEGSASPQSGTLEVQAGGSIEVARSFLGPDSMDRAAIAPDGPPVVQNESVSTPEDTAVTVDVLANDVDPDGRPLTVTAAVPYLGGGSIAINPDSTITYTPDPDSFGYIEVITYTVSDGTSTATGTLSVEVVAVNDPPVAVDDARTTDEDVPVLLTVLGNDGDSEGQPVELVSFGTPAHGTIEPHPLYRGDFSYIPAPDFNGTDSFTYTVRDNEGATAIATVIVTVVPVDDLSWIREDAATTTEDVAVVIPVLANDSDVDSPLAVASATQPAHGSTVVNGDGTITYTPAPNFSGTDSFDYHVLNGTFDFVAPVTVTVTPVNDAPDAVNDAATTNEDTATTISVLGNDTDPEGNSLTISAVTQGTKGSISTNGTTVTYTPDVNANGSDSFTYTISDGNLTDTATVSVIINPVNDAPDAINDGAATAEDSGVTIAVLANDGDVDGDALTVIAVTQGTKGTVSLNTNGSVSYVPALNTNGVDGFTYTVRDPSGSTDTATVTISVAAVNDPPFAGADSAATREGAAVSTSVLANDSDVEGNPLTVTAASAPAHGTASVNANTLTYTPAANYNGSDSFTYTLSDGQGGTATGTVSVTVKDALERTAILATHGVWIQTGADVLSGDVIVNQAGAAPFLDGGVELSMAGTVTTPAGYDVQANRINLAAGSTVASDAFYNTKTGTGSATGTQTSPLALPVFATLPAFRAATPGTTDVSVATNGTRTLAPGSYRDLIVAKRGTVTFTGGVYHFRSIQLNSQVKLLFSAAAEIRVQQRISALDLAQVKPAAGATIDGSDVIFFVAGINGTGGGLAETPKSVEIGIDGVLWANLYAPNGTIWLKDRTQARGAYLGKDIQAGPDVQVTLDSYWAGQ